MNKENFDCLLKEISGIRQEKFVYKMDTTEKKYTNYLSNDEFENYRLDLEVRYLQAYKNYDEAKGGELKPGRYPPKMASIASSSRFVVESIVKGDKDTLCEIFEVETEEISVEKELECIGVPDAKPSVDAYLENEKDIALIEAKCHEIFDSHELDFRPAYADTLKKEFKFDNHEKEIEKDYYGKMTTYYRYNRDPFTISGQRMMIDVKQMISHLLAAAKLFKDTKKSVTLWYMFFKPKIDDNDFESAEEVDKQFQKLRKQIDKVFNEHDHIKPFLNKYKIQLRCIFQHSSKMLPLDPKNIEVII